MNSEKRLIIVEGTRPSIIKITPVIKALQKKNIPYILIWTSQHKDYVMSKIFFEQFDLPNPDIIFNINIESDIVTKIFEIVIELRNFIINNRNKIFAIYSLGDTITTVAAALAAAYEGIPFIHDEAGMRSYDITMPEEINRRIADHIASMHFAPTKLAYYTLLQETSAKNVFLVGSTVVDIVSQYFSKILDYSKKIGFNDYILLTFHRRENLYNINRLQNFYKILEYVSQYYKIIFPVHPHTRNVLTKFGLFNKIRSNENIILTEPLGYLEFMAMLYKAIGIITDSGGVQEEALILGKPTITLRSRTEWPETVILGFNMLINLDSEINKEIYNKIITHLNLKLKPIPIDMLPIGDGKASNRIASILERAISGNINLTKNYDILNIYPIINTKSSNNLICFDENTGLPELSKPNSSKHDICIGKSLSVMDYDMLKKYIFVEWNKIKY